MTAEAARIHDDRCARRQRFGATEAREPPAPLPRCHQRAAPAHPPKPSHRPRRPAPVKRQPRPGPLPRESARRLEGGRAGQGVAVHRARSKSPRSCKGARAWQYPSPTARRQGCRDGFVGVPPRGTASKPGTFRELWAKIRQYSPISPSRNPQLSPRRTPFFGFAAANLGADRPALSFVSVKCKWARIRSAVRKRMSHCPDAPDPPDRAGKRLPWSQWRV